MNYNSKACDEGGYVYALVERESLRVVEPVVKIGMTEKGVRSRWGGYPKGSKLLWALRVKPGVKVEDVERQIIAELKAQFKQRHDLGREYFEGNIKQMVQVAWCVSLPFMDDTLLSYNDGGNEVKSPEVSDDGESAECEEDEEQEGRVASGGTGGAPAAPAVPDIFAKDPKHLVYTFVNAHRERYSGATLGVWTVLDDLSKWVVKEQPQARGLKWTANKVKAILWDCFRVKSVVRNGEEALAFPKLPQEQCGAKLACAGSVVRRFLSLGPDDGQPYHFVPSPDGGHVNLKLLQRLFKGFVQEQRMLDAGFRCKETLDEESVMMTMGLSVDRDVKTCRACGNKVFRPRVCCARYDRERRNSAKAVRGLELVHAECGEGADDMLG